MDVLYTILNYISIYIEAIAIAYMLYVISCIITRNIHPHSNRRIFLLSIITFLAYSVTKIFTDSTLVSSLFYILALSISVKLIFNVKIIPAMLSTLLVMLAIALLELLIVVVIKLFGYEPQHIKDNSIYNVFIILVLSLSCFIFTYFLFKYYLKIVFKSTKIDDTGKYLIPQCIAIIICLIPSMALLVKKNFDYSNAFIIINIIQLCVISLVSLYNIKTAMKQRMTELQLENMIIHNKTLTKVNEGVRGFKHDMGNIVQAILGYIALNDAEGAKKFCQNLVIGFNDINVLSILSPKVINEPAIYGVVVNKILVARENNMKLTLDINADVANINFPKFELSRMLGILLDNALEAGVKTDAKEFILTINTSPDNSYDEIIISNSIANTDIPLDKIFKKDYSSKIKPSGFGLYEVSNILNRYPQGLISTSIDKDKLMFTQKIKIFKI